MATRARCFKRTHWAARGGRARTVRPRRPPGRDRRLDTIHWISSGLTSLARGVNDAPKILAMLLLGGAVAAWPSDTMKVAAFVGAALAMGLGSFIGGYRVTEVLAEKVTRMDHVEGLSANLTTSSLVLVTATMDCRFPRRISAVPRLSHRLLKGLRSVAGRLCGTWYWPGSSRCQCQHFWRDWPMSS